MQNAFVISQFSSDGYESNEWIVAVRSDTEKVNAWLAEQGIVLSRDEEPRGKRILRARVLNVDSFKHFLKDTRRQVRIDPTHPEFEELIREATNTGFDPVQTYLVEKHELI